jgi:hypothetical protein
MTAPATASSRHHFGCDSMNYKRQRDTASRRAGTSLLEMVNERRPSGSGSGAPAGRPRAMRPARSRLPAAAASAGAHAHEQDNQIAHRKSSKRTSKFRPSARHLGADCPVATPMWPTLAAWTRAFGEIAGQNDRARPARKL